jgi:hypothetical protein
MTTIAAQPGTLDTSAPAAPASLVEFALESVPEPRIAPRQITDAERCAAVHDVAAAITNGWAYLTEDDRRELAATLLSAYVPAQPRPGVGSEQGNAPAGCRPPGRGTTQHGGGSS